MFRRRRERKAARKEFERAVEAASAKASKELEHELAAFKFEMLEGRREIAGIPGASPLCPRCDGRLVMSNVQSQSNWWRLWVCQSCGHKGRLADLPRGSLADVAE